MPDSSGEANLAPVRYILAPADVSACFVALGKAPPGAALYRSLPAANLTLPEVVTDGTGSLCPEARAMFDLLAEPARTLTLETLAGESPIGFRVRFIGDAEAGRFVMVAEEPDGFWDLALLTGLDQLLVVLDDLIGLQGPSQAAGAFSTTMGLSGLAAIGAYADLQREIQLMGEWQRAPFSIESWLAPIALEDLERMVSLAVDKPDMRSALTKLALWSDGMVPGPASRQLLADGLQQLGHVGLVDDEARITADGRALAIALNRPLLSASLTFLRHHDGGLIGDRLLVLRLPDTSLLGAWQHDSGGGLAALTLAELSPAKILATFQEQLTAQASDRTTAETSAAARPAAICAACGADLKPGKRFCTSCGARAT